MRVLLTHPPLSPAGEVTPPLGLCTLASWLRHAGHEVRIVDLELEIKRPPEAANQTYIDLFVRQVKDFVPHVVGITSMYNNSLQAERLMRAAKRCDAAIKIVAGGAHFGAMGFQSLRRIAELDFVIEGEGERAFALLLEAVERGTPLSEIPRLCYRANEELRANPAGALLELEDIAAIEADPEFFAGYFAPYSEAGSFTQLAQVEMFFDFATALAPFTISALSCFIGDRLVPSFYEVLSESGGVTRAGLDFEGINLYNNWLAIRPLMDAWLARHSDVGVWQYELLRGLMNYETRRIQFVGKCADGVNDALAFGDDWVAFESAVNINGVVERLRANGELTSDLLEENIIVLARKGADAFDGYTLDATLAPEVKRHSPDLLSVFNRETKVVHSPPPTSLT